MVFPIIPIAALAVTALGLGTLVWYWRLSPQERERADQIANEIALEVCGKALNELSKPETRRVMTMVRKQMRRVANKD